MAATDAMILPRKNVAFRTYFDMRKNDGSILVGWTGAAALLSKDGGATAAPAGTVTEITNFGCGYLDLTSTEMNADNVMIRITVTNTGALPTTVALYPTEDSDIRVNLVQILSTVAATIADTVLRRTTANVEASSDGDTLGARSLYGAVARLAHKISISGSTMTITKSDDTTSLTTAALTTNASADPTTGIDPV